MLAEVRRLPRVPDALPGVSVGVRGAVASAIGRPTPCVSNGDCTNGLTCVDFAGPSMLDLDALLTGANRSGVLVQCLLLSVSETTDVCV